MTRNDLLILGIVGAAIAVFFYRQKAGIQFSDADLNNAAAIVLAETDFRAPDKREEAAILWLIYNRSQKYGVSIATAASPSGPPNWNSSSKFKKRFAEAFDRPNFSQVKEFARSVYSGAKHPTLTPPGLRNLSPSSVNVGDRMYFVHPRGMTRCEVEGQRCGKNNSRHCVMTQSGLRCLPDRQQNDFANVVVIGRARFS